MPPLLRLLVVCFASFLLPASLCAQATAKLLVTNAYIFSMAPSQHEPFRGYLLVGTDGHLLAIAAGDPPANTKAAARWDAGGDWITPGFISAHSHLWQSAYRGLAADQTLTGWIDELYGKRIAHASAEDFYWFTLEGAVDHLRHGVTAAYNFNHDGNFGSKNAVRGEEFNQAEFKAEEASGIRFVHGLNHGASDTPAEVADSKAKFKHFLDWANAQHAQPQMLSVMINGYAAFSPNDHAAKLEGQLMREFHLGNQSHYLEPPESQVEERNKFPWFMDNGIVGPQLIWGHFIHTDPAIIATSGKAGAAMSWNPLSNGRLASGVADIPAYLKAGIRVGMGVDGEASADLADPFENMRTGLYAIRDKYQSAAIMSPYDVMRLHTMGSADVLGVADRLGSLEPGKLADFVVIDPSHFAHVFDPYATLVFVTSQPDLDRVYVGGELLVEHGTLLRQDLKHIESEVDRRVTQSVGK
jgi:5-methylthioadenosine/S-adenosylhomocysteine deaminase